MTWPLKVIALSVAQNVIRAIHCKSNKKYCSNAKLFHTNVISTCIQLLSDKLLNWRLFTTQGWIVLVTLRLNEVNCHEFNVGYCLI